MNLIKHSLWKLVIVFLAMPLNLMAVQLGSTETFTSGIDPWVGDPTTGIRQYASGATKRMEIDSQATASRTYTFSGYENQPFRMTLTTTEIDTINTWESSDTTIIKFNGVVVYNSATSGSLVLHGGFDSSGTVSVTITANTDNSVEKLHVDNISLYSDPVYTADNERPFSLQFTANEIGDMVTFGNTILCKSSIQNSNYKNGTCSQPLAADSNDNIYTLYNKLASDVGDSTIFNSSSSDLTIPAGSTVLKAILYWQGGINSDTIDTATGDASLTTMALAMQKARTVRFKVPGASYVAVTSSGSKFNWNNNAANYNYYQGAADVTSMVQQSGTYQVANLVTNDGDHDGGTGPYGGWSLMVVYQDMTSGTSHLKNMVIYDGYKLVTADVTQTFSGFYTPISGDVNAKFTMFATEADVTRLDTITMNTVSIATNELASAIEDSTGASVTTRSPNYTNTIGTDIHTWDVGDNNDGVLDIIGNSQSSATVVFDYPGGVNADIYNLGAFSFATDLYQPQVCYIENIFKDTTNISGIGAQVNEDDNLTVRVYIKNTGNDNAEQVQILHQFDDQFPYVTSSANYNNSNPPYETLMPPSYTRTIASDSSGNDLYEYDTTTLISKIKVGSGATSSTGGIFYPTSSGTPTYAVYEYQASVKALDSNYSNVYKAAYINSALGIDYSNNPVTMQSCDGSINSFYGIGGVVITASGFDARETSIIESDNDRTIKTKIVEQPFTLNVISLDSSGGIAPYALNLGSRVYLFPVESEVCTQSDADKLAAIQSLPHTVYVDFVKTNITRTSPNLNVSAASKDKRIALNYMNWNDYASDLSALHCSVSNTGGSTLLGVPQCFEAAGGMCSRLGKVTSNIECLFGPAVALACAGSNSDGDSAAGDFPCNGSSYAGSNLPDAPFDNEYGCYQCVTQMAGAVTCSTNNFAARPDRFEIVMSGGGSLNLLKSGEENNVTIHAYNAINANTVDYDQLSSDITVTAIKQMPDGTVNNALNGNASFPNIFSFTDGLSGAGAAVAFSDVGRVTVDMNDTNWAAVDLPDIDITAADYTIQGQGNFTFIPFQFALSNIQIVDSRGGNFTYLSNDLNMSAKFDFIITSQNKQGGTTLNFATGLYEHPLSITPTVVDTVRGDATESTIVSSLTGFTAGVNHLTWDDLNTSKVLKFNFPRNPALPIDPFEVNATEANLSVNGLYVDGGFSATIENNTTNKAGATNGTTGNALFLYGRADAPDYRFADKTPADAAASGCGRIYFELYNTVANNPLITGIFGGVMPALSSSPDQNWYQNTLHDRSTDGNVSAVTAPAIVVYNFGVNPGNACIGSLSGGGFEKRVFEYDGSFGYPYRATTQLDSSDWLDVNGNNFGIEFYKAGGWVGEQKANTATDAEAETITNRRIMW